MKIDLCIRGLCCLRPGVKGVSENITVTSIVDRLLEHARIYYFENGGDPRMYMGSSDMSLARKLVDRGETDTLLDRHEERHNLYAYLGKPDFFHPFVSNKTPLRDGDILAL